MPRSIVKRSLAAAAALTAGVATAVTATDGATSLAEPAPATASPIQHLVVIYQENVSFDHYFGTYPRAGSTGQPFTAAPGTPTVNGLSGALLTANPNGTNPRRYDPTNVADLLTCDQDHDYTDEQKAFDGGAMDRFPQTVGNGRARARRATPAFRVTS